MQALSSTSLPSCIIYIAIALYNAFASNAPTDSYDISDDFINGTSNSIDRKSYLFFMPPGCLCRINGMMNGEQCDQFDCPCKCDLTAGACDMNCCCDQECSKDSTSFEQCLDEDFSSATLKTCADGMSALEDVNIKYPMDMANSLENHIHGLLCIEKDNSAVKGSFFKDQGYPSASKVFSPGSRVAKPLGFNSYALTTPFRSNGSYKLGDKIAVFTLSSNEQVIPAFGGYLTLPSADSSGHCLELNVASFGKSEKKSCLTKTNDLAYECERKFNALRYISNIVVEQEKGSVPIGVSHQSEIHNSYLSINIEKFTNSSGHTSADTDKVDLTLWNATLDSCINALKALTYNVRYNQTSIIDVSVELQTANIVLGSSEWIQEFAIKFIPMEVEPSERSYSKNNFITRSRSGNPGYIIGMPTLGARRPERNDSVSYVIAQKAGFTVMDTGLGGQCNTSSRTGSVVGFAKDIFVGCTHAMTRQELKDFCTLNQHPMLSSYKQGMEAYRFPKWLDTNLEFLGIFGNADPLEKKQWIQIESSLDDTVYTSKSRHWIEAENRCVGIPSRLRYEILWTYVGNLKSPQAKILSAKKTYDDGPSFTHTASPSMKQPFPFITTVSWSFLHPAHDTLNRSPPTYIFSVPYDVFYPF